MLDTILFVILGLLAFWVLTAIFETIALKDHPYLARVFAAVLTIVSACIGTGYRHWWQVLIGIGAAFAYLQLLKEAHRKSAAKPQQATPVRRLPPPARPPPIHALRSRP